MSELRKNPVNGRWVIVATERNLKPYDFEPPYEIRRPGPCVFCSGMESATPQEVYSAGRNGSVPDTPGWKVRVVPNKFPALRIEEKSSLTGIGIYQKTGGFGAHEVIIETPDHQLDLADLSVEEIEMVLRAYQERMADLQADRRIRYCVIFKNQGSQAGASIQHAHSQLIGVSVVPKLVQEELEEAEVFYRKHGECIFCHSVREELSSGKRVVTSNQSFLASIPFAPRFPYETWIIPLQHEAHFTQVDHSTMRAFGDILKRVLLGIKHTLGDPPFNYLLHVAPYPCGDDSTYRKSYHWHLEILPILTKVAGFEWGTGFYINPVIPEAAARTLREGLPVEQ